MPKIWPLPLDSKRSLLSIVVAAFLASACATQTYQSQPIALEQTAQRFLTRDLNSAELRAYMQAQAYPAEALPVTRWGLRELTLAAFFYHPQLSVAHAQWQAARAQEVTAAQQPNPSVNGDLEHHSDTTGGVSPWTLGFSFDFPIETGGKREKRIARAELLSQAARIDIGQQAWQIRSELHKRWINYRAAVQQLALLQHEIELQQAIVQMLEKRLEAGMVSDIDLATARLHQQKLQNTYAADRAHIVELRTELALAIGIPAKALDGIALDERPAARQDFMQLPSAEIQRAALLNRLDIRSALVRYDAAEAKLRLEIANQRPDIVLSPGLMFDQGDNLWLLGLSLLNIGNMNEGPIAEAEADRTLQARQFEALQAKVIGEQSQALAQYESRLAELDQAERMVASQQQHVAKNERQFQAGYIDRLEWTTAQLESLAAEQGRLAAAIRVEQAQASLEDALQRPLDGSDMPTPESLSKDAQP